MEENKDYFTCDYCHRVGTGITIVNGFKMCPMCLAEYQHKSGENNKLREELGIKHKEVEQLKHDLALYKTAFGNVLYDADEKITTIYRNDCCCSVEMENSKFYLEQAEKELKGEKDE